MHPTLPSRPHGTSTPRPWLKQFYRFCLAILKSIIILRKEGQVFLVIAAAISHHAVHTSRSVQGVYGNKPPSRHMAQVKQAAEQVYMASVTVSKALLKIALHSPAAFCAAQGPQAS